MNFDLSEEQQLLADSLKRYLNNEYSIDARAKIVASPTGWSETVWAAFAEMGLLGVLAVHLFHVAVQLTRTSKWRRSAPRRLEFAPDGRRDRTPAYAAVEPVG